MKVFSLLNSRSEDQGSRESSTANSGRSFFAQPVSQSQERRVFPLLRSPGQVSAKTPRCFEDTEPLRRNISAEACKLDLCLI